MSFRICCPQCGAYCTVADNDVGRTALCGNCDHPIIISKTPTKQLPVQPSDFADSPYPVTEHELDPASAHALLRPGTRDRSRSWRCGCTCAIALVSVFLIAALLLPMYRGGGREPGRRSQCTNNMKQIALALHNYHDVHGSFPPPYIADENGRPMHSWRVLILPYLEERNLYAQYDFDEPWDGPSNRKLWSQIPYAYRCPSAEYLDDALTPYQAIVGENAVFERKGSTSLHDIYDGTSNTILVVEAASSPVHWMEPRDVRYEPRRPLPDELRSSNHQGTGLHVTLADGSIKFLDQEISTAELRSLIERSDGVYHVR